MVCRLLSACFFCNEGQSLITYFFDDDMALLHPNFSINNYIITFTYASVMSDDDIYYVNTPMKYTVFSSAM